MDSILVLACHQLPQTNTPRTTIKHVDYRQRNLDYAHARPWLLVSVR